MHTTLSVPPEPGSMSCWVGSFSFDVCCAGPWGVGLSACWDEHFNWKICCEAELTERLREQGIESLEEATKSGQDIDNIMELVHPGGAKPWQKDMHDCLHEYDIPHNYHWYQRHSGMLGHEMSHAGNPLACLQGGHRYFWGFILFRVDLASLRDIALEHGLCVPRACSYAVVDSVFVPFLYGRYFGKDWGPPGPEIATRWKHDSYDEVEKTQTVSHFFFQNVATHPAGPAGWYRHEWPYRQGLWEYQQTWRPSKINSMVLAFLALPPLLAGVCLKLSNVCSAPRSDSERKATPRRVLALFAPQCHLTELCKSSRNPRPASNEEDLPGLHYLRIVLQLLITWQHVVLLVDWFGNSGYTGIKSFAPLTNDLAKVFSRVNSTFACVTAYLSFRSMERALQLAEQSSQNQKGLVRSAVVIYFWVLKRWVKQAAELGFWTFFFLCLSRDIPWKPFPDFVQVWYQDRRDKCMAWPANGVTGEPKWPPLPMWLLSLLFIYEPANAIFGLYRHAVTLCHNMQIFETLFNVSLAGAGLGLIHHRLGRDSMLAVAMAAVAIALWWEPEILHDGFRWSYRYVGATTANMMPIALTTVVLMVHWPAKLRPSPGQRSLFWALGLIILGLVADFFTLDFKDKGDHQDHQREPDVMYSFSSTKAAIFMGCEGLHALGVTLLLFSQKGGVEGGAGSPGWLVLGASRLSLGINISNIFVIQYVRGRTMIQPIEFNHIHVVTYTVLCWLIAVMVSAMVHCAVAPYVELSNSMLMAVSEKLIDSQPIGKNVMPSAAVKANGRK
eukprot:TRINITY_DN107853_c0_g1_i1.p1 TRINITY_DN107853_c0_g1~~TRINITY_DN107853_c0_g1_i1.p1  ORF type:complete len:784 (-),score=69.65 TRINITY_DN107853_c0_g1_i1:5-2356(-)